MKKKLKPNTQITMTVKEKEKMKKKAIADALQIITLFPLLALRDEFGFGEKRLKRFMDRMHNDIDAYEKGYLDLADVATTLKKEVNIEVVDE